VSTILRSLKRLEKEKEDQFVQNHVSLTSFNTRSVVNQTVRFAWLRNRVIQWTIALTICIIGAVGIYAYSRPVGNKHKINTPGDMRQAEGERKHYDMKARPSTSTKRNRPVDQSQSQPPNAQLNKTIAAMKEHSPGSSGIPKSSKEILKSRQYPEVKLPEVKGRPAVNTAKPQINPEAASVPSAMASKRGQTPLQAAQSHEMQADKAPDSDQRLQEKAMQAQPDKTGGPEFQPENNAYRNAERMTDGRLKVQAIVWAPDAKKRMAVVNSQVIREGGIIEGFTVVGIGEDAVYVREKGTGLLKVPFGQP